MFVCLTLSPPTAFDLGGTVGAFFNFFSQFSWLLAALYSTHISLSLSPLLILLRGRSHREREFQSMNMPEVLMSGVMEIGECHQS